MIARVWRRTPSTVRVQVDEVPITAPHGQILDAALDSARLRRSNLFDYDIDRDGPRALVTLVVD